MNHTPGPWKYASGDNASCEINIGETTASVCRWEKNTGKYVIEREEMEANAKLIAAAPDLLKHLVNILNWHKAHDAISFLEEDAIKAAESAIAKATA